MVHSNKGKPININIMNKYWGNLDSYDYNNYKLSYLSLVYLPVLSPEGGDAAEETAGTGAELPAWHLDR